MIGHAQGLSWSQRNSESTAKTIGDRMAADGEIGVSTTVKHQKICLPATAAEEFDLNSIDWDVPLLETNSFVLPRGVCRWQLTYRWQRKGHAQEPKRS